MAGGCVLPPPPPQPHPLNYGGVTAELSRAEGPLAELYTHTTVPVMANGMFRGRDYAPKLDHGRDVAQG